MLKQSLKKQSNFIILGKALSKQKNLSQFVYLLFYF